jgi:hypothetical protein
MKVMQMKRQQVAGTASETPFGSIPRILESILIALAFSQVIEMLGRDP